MPFSSLGLSAPLLRAAAVYAAPTPVQVAAIPAILAGGDVLATADTGSGKTAAYLLPLFERCISARRDRPRCVDFLILVPTRELAAQVREVAQEFATHLPERVKVVSAVGGVSINPQMMALRGGTDFLVATPGRLLDLVNQNAVNLSEVKSLVIDEADRLFDSGFSEELHGILKQLPRKRQNLLFSATFPKPVESLANDLLHHPTRISVESEPEEGAVIRQRTIRVDSAKRAPLLRHLIASEAWDRVLVFVATQYSADHVADKLRRNGIGALSFHGDLSQGARSQVLLDFKNSLFQVLVATDLAARGLDIVKLPVVVNYDLPRSAVDYTHRIGRTARAGRSGLAISFVTSESAAHFSLIEKRLDLNLPQEQVPGFEPSETAKATPSDGGGIKGKRRSKKDKLRDAAARSRPQSDSPS